MFLDLIENYGIRDIYIQDDTFVMNKDNVIEFCNILIKENVDVTWACHGRIDHLDRELLQSMKKSGCWQVSLGIESGSNKILKTINKGTTVEQNFEALNLCKEVGIDVKGLFMIGSFGENHETIEETKSFINKAYLTDFHMSFFTPLAGTAAIKIWHKYGHFDPSKGSFLTKSPSFIPFDLTEEELVHFRKLILKKFYLRPRIIRNYLLKLFLLRNSSKIMLSAVAFLKYVYRK